MGRLYPFVPCRNSSRSTIRPRIPDDYRNLHFVLCKDPVLRTFTSSNDLLSVRQSLFTTYYSTSPQSVWTPDLDRTEEGSTHRELFREGVRLGVKEVEGSQGRSRLRVLEVLRLVLGVNLPSLPKTIGVSRRNETYSSVLFYRNLIFLNKFFGFYEFPDRWTSESHLFLKLAFCPASFGVYLSPTAFLSWTGKSLRRID